MTEPLGNLQGIKQNKINKNQPKQEDFSLKYAASVFNQDSKAKSNGDIFKTGNKKLIDTYNVFKKAVSSHDKKKISEAADEFTVNSLMEDLSDDGKINQSILKKGNKFGKLSQVTNDISKDDLLKIILKADKADDGAVNGSVISNNPGLQKYLDIADNKKEDNSVQNYNSYLKTEGYEPAQNYNVFDSMSPLSGLPVLDSLGSSLDPFGMGEIRNMMREIIYNPNEYADVSRKDYQYSVKPDSIAQDGATGKAVYNALDQIGAKESDQSYKKFTQGRTEAWCADFVSWAYEKANGGVCPWGYRDKKGNYKAAVTEIADWGRKNSLFRENNQQSRNNLKSGDLITFKNSIGNHIGMVSRVDKDANGNVTAIHTIEGNTSDKVAERTYPVTNSQIAGFIDMNKWQSGSKAG